MTVFMQSKIVGTYYRGKDAMEYLRNLPVGEKFNLAPEPLNEFDSNAVAILSTISEEEQIHLGYIPKEINESILKYMNEGIDLVVTYKGKSNIEIASKDYKKSTLMTLISD